MGADAEYLLRIGAETVRLGLRFLHDSCRPLFRAVADVVGRFAGRTQQAGRLLAEGVEQLLLVEWPGRVQLLLEIVERGNKLFLAFAGRCELLGDTAEERAHLGGGVAAHARRERTIGDVVDREPGRAADDPLPTLGLSHATPPRTGEQDRASS